MLKLCRYCNRIHEKNIRCSSAPVKHKTITDKDRFRWTAVWQKKREHIKKRDKYLCQWCLYHRHTLNYTDLQVHHIVPLEEAYDLRLDDDNLITLCAFPCHEEAESGKIKREDLQKIIAGKYPREG